MNCISIWEILILRKGGVVVDLNMTLFIPIEPMYKRCYGKYSNLVKYNKLYTKEIQTL